MGDGSGDLQRVWHEHVGVMLDGVSILDVGAGIGKSKERLSRGGRNTVTTQDINRALMERVDRICDVKSLPTRSWDVVTAFDVVEHAVDPASFVVDMATRARRAIFFTTPNYVLYPRPWHFRPEEVAALAARVGDCVGARWFLRHRVGEVDRVEEVSQTVFLEDKVAYAYGVYIEVVA